MKLQKNYTKKELKEKSDYNFYQEDLAFAKELNILRNDFYYQMLDTDDISLLDFLYSPLDIMSGDAYSARAIDKNNTFYLMLDGMGKGVSASLTAMIMTSFINHVLDKMISSDSFDLGILIHETMRYIQPILLEEEALSIDYILIDDEENMLYYAKFSMPALLMQNKNNEIIRLKSNNPPLCKYQPTFNIESYDIREIIKFLIYTDGIVENETICNNIPYAEYIEKDFLNSFSKEDLKKNFFEKVKKPTDDITLIYIHKLNSISHEIASKVFNSTMNCIEHADFWYEEIWQNITNDVKESYQASIVFTELFMNAYEHGNLGICASEKNDLLADDTYLTVLSEKEKDCVKKISVNVKQIKQETSSYIITQITDEGEGFNTQTLSEIFRNSLTFNGRGVFVSRKNSSGIYYNSKGNSVLFLNKVSKS